MWKVYGLVDPRDERIRYVGCTTAKWLSSRLAAHVDQAKFSTRRGYKAKRSEWIREVLDAGLRPQIMPLQTAFSEEEAAFLEHAWINRFGEQLTNELAGGPGSSPISPELRKRKAEKMRQRWEEMSPENREREIARLRVVAQKSGPAARARSNEYWRGSKHSEESKRKMRDAKFGKSVSDVQRQRIREGHQDAGYKQRQRERAKALWADPDYRERMLQARREGIEKRRQERERGTQ